MATISCVKINNLRTHLHVVTVSEKVSGKVSGKVS